MKRIFIFVALLVIALMLGSSPGSLATSGACSSHGGVDCSAGAGTNDKIICNDGWTGSSVNYYDTAECSDNFCPAQWVLFKALYIKAGWTEEEVNLFVAKQIIPNRIDVPTDLGTFHSIVDTVKSFRNSCKKSSLPSSPTNTCPANASLGSDGQCYCPFAQILNKQKTKCLTFQEYENSGEMVVCGANSFITPTRECACNDGFTKTNDQCISTKNISSIPKPPVGAKVISPEGFLIRLQDERKSWAVGWAKNNPGISYEYVVSKIECSSYSGRWIKLRDNFLRIFFTEKSKPNKQYVCVRSVDATGNKSQITVNKLP